MSWGNEITNALENGRVQAIVDANSFFTAELEDLVYDRLAEISSFTGNFREEYGVWKFKYRNSDLPKKPYRVVTSRQPTDNGGTTTRV